jgi:hypothetical protein
MTATIPKEEVRGINTNHRKEDHFSQQLSALVVNGDHIHEAVIARIYCTNNRSYACLWVNGRSAWSSGSGFAGGGGYHKASAALQAAISNAGIHLDRSIDGVGQSAMEEAVRAIAEAVYPGVPVYIHQAHA